MDYSRLKAYANYARPVSHNSRSEAVDDRFGLVNQRSMLRKHDHQTENQKRHQCQRDVNHHLAPTRQQALLQKAMASAFLDTYKFRMFQLPRAISCAVA